MDKDGAFLAQNWQCGKVIRYLEAGEAQKHLLVCFLQERHYERFFEPIGSLIHAGRTQRGFGFSIMSLCCLLIETIECYCLGWPSSSPKELRQLEASPHNLAVPSNDFKISGPYEPHKYSSEQAFIKFFDDSLHNLHFPDLVGKGRNFYSSIRCGLLHQAQTKDGWRIRTSGKLYDDSPDKKSINRDAFAQALQNCFDSLLKELEKAEWDGALWKAVRKKMWWLAVTS
ncbi:MAG TPA: hypothetical protein VGR03_03095 [Candidatus Acidoferrum sp.]|nr:hypothetical protein [Candidatus Acidoferrum sp.]HVS74888.1 hypothetical protein [Candidatus Acidoferrales bacterium]